MPRYKGEWVHWVHFNQFPDRKKERGQLQFGGGNQKNPLRKLLPTPKRPDHVERMRRLFKDYDEWDDDRKLAIMEWDDEHNAH